MLTSLSVVMVSGNFDDLSFETRLILIRVRWEVEIRKQIFEGNTRPWLDPFKKLVAALFIDFLQDVHLFWIRNS